ncbi:MAG: S9 family peptidase [Oliverpabstia sp.]
MSEKRLPQIGDFARIRSASEPVHNAASGRTAWVESGWSDIEETYYSHIVFQTGEMISAGGMKESMPRFTADGKVLYFLSDAEGPAQIFRYVFDSGVTERVTNFPHEVTWYTVSPVADEIALVTYRYAQEHSEEAEKAEPLVTEQRGYRQNGIRGFRKRQLKQICLLDPKSGTVREVYGEEYDVNEPSWTPDGKALLVLGEEDDGFTLTRIDQDTGEKKVIFCDEKYGLSDDFSPAMMTPDGKKIVFTAEIAEESDLSHSSLYMIPAEGGAVIELLDPEKENDGVLPALENASNMGNDHFMLQLSSDGESVYFIASFEGCANLWKVPLAEHGQMQQITFGEQYLLGIDRQYGDYMLGLCGGPDRLPDIFSICLKDGSMEQISYVNQWIDEIEISKPETFWTQSADSAFSQQGWVIRPQKMEDGKRYPTVLYVHGGPKVHFCCGMNYELQCLAAAGIGVIYCNPRSSTGYGKAFADDDAAWDGRAYDDVMEFLRKSMERFEWINPNRLGIAGKSYGGYMSVWAAGHSKQFKAVSAQSAMVGECVLYASSDCAVSDYSDEDRSLTEFLSDYIDKSPVSYADQITSPLLILQGDCDYRCPAAGARQLYKAVRDYHPEVPAKLVIFPDSDHGMTYDGPMNIKLRFFSENLNWFRTYL